VVNKRGINEAYWHREIMKVAGNYGTDTSAANRIRHVVLKCPVRTYSLVFPNRGTDGWLFPDDDPDREKRERLDALAERLNEICLSEPFCAGVFRQIVNDAHKVIFDGISYFKI
jgi:hypothetical protein